MIKLLLMPLQGRLSPERLVMAEQFLKFGVVGTIGFVVDTAVIYALNPFLGPYYAAVISFFVVGSLNWLLNRIWTYRDLDHAAAHRQLVAFLGANAIGFVINRGSYAALVHYVAFCHAHLVVPIAAAAVIGMFFNFFLSRRLVFKA